MALKPLNSVAGFSVGETPNVVIYGNGDITTGNLAVTGKSNLNSLGNVFISGGSNGQVIQTDGSGNLTFVTIDTWRIQNGTSNVQVAPVNGNVTVTVAGNANIATFTSTGVNVSGYLSVDGDVSANGNLSANNYLVTPATKDLIVAPATQLTRFYSNINPYSDATYSLGNGLSRWTNIFTGEANISGNANIGSVRTDNLLYANGTPWDLQQAAGSNTQIQYNSNNDFGASANFTYNDSTSTLSVVGNANITTVNTANVNSGTSGFAITANGFTANFYANGVVEFADGISTTGNINAGNAVIGNLISANYVNVTSNLSVTDTANVGNLRTDNLLYANGQPWDLQEAAGSNTQIQYNDGNNNFGASANFTYNDATQLLTVNGNAQFNNANLGNLAIANFVNVASNTITNNLTVNLELAGNTANFSGNVITNNLTTNLELSGNTANFSGNVITNNLTTNLELSGNTANFSGNVVVNNLTTNLELSGNTANFSSNVTVNNLTTNLELSGNTANFSGNLIADNITGNGIVDAGNLNVVNNLLSNLIPNVDATYTLGNSTNRFGNVYAANFIGNISGNLAAPGANTDVIFNDSNVANAVANFTYDKAYNSGGGRLNVGNTVGGEIITDTFYASYANINGNIATSGNVSATGNINGNNITASGNISTTGAGGDITMTGGDITGVNNISANSANYSANVIVNNLTVNLEISGNTANFTGNINSALNANLGNLVTANYVNVANDINVLGNVVAANFVGALANGNSNVKVYQNANVEVTINGSANVATFASTGLYVVGEINTTAGNMLSNGNITANGFLNAPNANVTGQVAAGSVLTSNITAPSGNITISAAGTNQNITLNPSGTGNVDVGLHNIVQVGAPVNPNDAATKEYVDTISQGIFIHPTANVTAVTNLNATYTNGGTALTVTTIAGGKTITFSANHGLAVNDDIEFTNSFNGLIAGNEYFVYSVPALNQITVKDGYFGAEVTTLTNGTGLTQPALGNGGVGATLTNAGAQAALTIDSVLMTTGARVLVQGQTNGFENGIYDVTTVGTGSTNWVLTRSSDGDSYQPKSSTALCSGSYFFITQGTQYTGASYVLTAPTGEINIGTSNIVFDQFSKAGAYNAGAGINITGTIISANTDGVTTDIVGGNIVVKAGANLTTPNLGDATFSSLSWNNLSNGNVSANNLSTSNIANIGTDLTVGNSIVANGNISSNATLNGNALFITNDANIQGNILSNNITANFEFSTTNANISANLITANATVNLELSGNTANFSGNVVMNNATVNLELSGNTANFSGNVVTNNLTNNLEFSGNTANFSGAVILNDLTVNLNVSGNTANFTGNISAANANLGNLATANYFTGTLINGSSNAFIDGSGGNFNVSVAGNANVFQVTGSNANINGNLNVSGNFNINNIVSNVVTANTAVNIGNTTITWDTVTTTSVTANQTIASLNTTGITGLEFLVKAVDAGGKYSIATVQAVTDGTSVDYATFGTVQLGGYTGSLAVNVVGGYVRLQVTPASSNSTVWTTQARTI